jgi:hypothetical protein
MDQVVATATRGRVQLVLYISIITHTTNLYPVGQEYQDFHQMSDMWPHSLIGQVRLAHGDDCWIVPVVLDCLELHVELSVLFLLPPMRQRYYSMLSNPMPVQAITLPFCPCWYGHITACASVLIILRFLY